MNWYIEVLKKYAVFSGRAGRSEYWYFVLFNIIISFAIAVFERLIGSGGSMGLLGTVYALAVFLPGLAVSVRRLHDTGRSGWWLLVGIIPLVGLIVLIIFMVEDSHPGTNLYGASPKGAIA